MLRDTKLSVLRWATKARLPQIVMSSGWRRSRLLILCYHGIALDDEHRWCPGMYVTAEHFRARLARLRELNCAVLPLGEALERLWAGSLPARSVAITFDDGFCDFYKLAWPILKEFSWPATVYLTTYYSERHEWPVPDLMSGYILWKADGRRLDWPELFRQPVLLSAETRRDVEAAIYEHWIKTEMSAREKNDMLIALAGRLRVDLADAGDKRLFRIMRSEEVKDAACGGVDIELHTHRHRVFRQRERFWREIDENRERICGLTGRNAHHFCYPGGFRLNEFPLWLRQRGVISATTCEVGMASQASNPMLLPRLLDTGVSDEEFDAWVTGLASFMPKRVYPASPTQLGQESAPEGGALDSSIPA